MMLDATTKFQVAFKKLDNEGSSYISFFSDESPPPVIIGNMPKLFLSF